MTGYPFQVGVTSLTEPMQDEIANLRVAREMGFSHVEVTLEYPRSLPVRSALKTEMLRHREKYGMTYTIHLPLSLHMTDVNPLTREASLQTLDHIFREMEEIGPKAYVLHVSPFFLTGGTPLGRAFDLRLHEERLEGAWDSLARLCQIIEPRKVAVENLYHELRFQEEMIREFDYSVCMDVGHLLMNADDPYIFYHKYRERIKVIHLHDVVNGRDHQQLGEPGSTLDLLSFFYLLKKDNYHETIILEQFQRAHIDQSRKTIAGVWAELA